MILCCVAIGAIGIAMRETRIADQLRTSLTERNAALEAEQQAKNEAKAFAKKESLARTEVERALSINEMQRGVGECERGRLVGIARLARAGRLLRPNDPLTGTIGRFIGIWDKELPKVNPYNAFVSATTIHPKGDSYAVGCPDGAIRTYAAFDHQILSAAQIRFAPRDLIYSLDASQLFVIGQGGELAALNAANLKPIVLPNSVPQQHVTAIQFATDNDNVMVCEVGGSIIFNRRNWELVARFEHPNMKLGVLSPDSQRLATLGSDGKVNLWRCDSPNVVDTTLDQPMANVNYVSFANGSERLVTSSDLSADLWNVADGTLVKNIVAEKAGNLKTLVGPSGQLLLTTGYASGGNIWDAKDAHAVATFIDCRPTSDHFAFTGDGLSVVSAGPTCVSVWDSKTGELTFRSSSYESMSMRQLQVSRSGDWCATTNKQGTILIHTLTGSAPAVELDRLKCGVCFYRGDVLVSDNGGDFYVIDPVTDRLKGRIGFGSTIATIAKIGPDDREVFAMARHNVVEFGDPRTRRVTGEMLMHDFDVVCIAYSPVARVIATGCIDGSLWIWDSRTLALVSTIGKTDEKEVWRDPFAVRIAITADGRDIVYGGPRLGLRMLHNFRNGSAPVILESDRPVTSITAFPSDARVIVTFADHSARIWILSSHPQIGVLIQNDAAFLASAVHPDGRLLAFNDVRGKVTLWEADDGRKLGSPLYRPSTVYDLPTEINHLAFSPNGEFLMCSGVESGTQVWRISDSPVPPAQLTEWAMNRTGYTIDESGTVLQNKPVPAKK
jgi:WD40 repeat protein